MDLINHEQENIPPSTRYSNNDSQISSESQMDTSSKAPTIDDFVLAKPISRGAFGKVFLGHKRSRPGKMYAIKVMKKADMVNKNLVNQVIAERDALASASCPFIVELYYSMQSQHNIYLIMEYLIGGDVKSLLSIYGYFDEDMAVLYTAEVILALEYLHKKGIIHRDIKPDNMLVSSAGHIKLTDFGLSKITLKPENTPHQMLKTPGGENLLLAQQDYRTPGQILSLASSFAFSIPNSAKCKRSRRSQTSSHGSRGLPAHVGRSPYFKGTPRGSLEKMIAFRDRSARTSAISQMTPPVKSLTPTLQDSINWLNSTTSGPGSGVTRERKSSTSLIRGLFNSSAVSTGMCTPSQVSAGEDDVFKGGSGTSYSQLSSSGLSSLLSNPKSHEVEVIPSPHCDSHLKAAEKQENITDDTPQLHRTNESLWNSYAARNLRSMREGSYSEDNDEVDGFLKSPLPPTKNAFITQAKSDLLTTPRCSSRTSNKSHCGYAYLSDEDDEDLSSLSQSLSAGDRKRSFSQLDCRSQKHTGMTGVFDQLQLMGDENRVKKRILGDGNDPRAEPVEMDVDWNMSNPEPDSLLSDQMQGDHHSLSPPAFPSVLQFSFNHTNEDLQDKRMSDKPYSMKYTENRLVLDSQNCDNSSTVLPLSDEQSLASSSSDTSPPCHPMSATTCDQQSVSNSELSPDNKTTTGEKKQPLVPIPNFWTPRTPAEVCHKTPFRTPKSVRRGPVDDDQRILGTPDYLAPELLLQRGHGPGVDWWALGVCLFEFLTGFPPFNDQTPDLVFQNILNRDVPWPEDEESLSELAQEAVDKILTHDPKFRPRAKGIKGLPLFAEVDWDNLLSKEPPFVPQPDDETDTSYFQARNSIQHLTVSAVDP